MTSLNLKRMIIFLLSTMYVAGCTPSLENSGDSHTGIDAKHAWETWETCSQITGDHPCDFTLTDQNGTDVSLSDFHGGVIVLDLSTMWCGPCQMAASETQSVQDKYSGRITYITVLIENLEGVDPVQKDLSLWSDVFGINAPILGGSRNLIDAGGVIGWPIEVWPTFFFITDEMVLHGSMRGFSSSYLESFIEDTLEQ